MMALLLLVISNALILTMGRSCELRFRLNGESSPVLSVESAGGEVEVLAEKAAGGEYLVKVAARKPGRVFLGITQGDAREEKLLYVHPSMVITDNNYFGRSRGSEVIPVSLSLLLLYLLYILVGRYRRSAEENLYQYRNIRYLGLIIFLAFFTLSTVMSIFHYQGLYGTVSSFISSASGVSIFLFPLAFITFILVTASNINLIRKEGRSLKNLLGLFLGVFLCFFTLLPDLSYRFLMRAQIVNIYDLNSIGPYLYDSIEAFVYLTIAYLECLLLGTIILAVRSVKKKMAYDKDYLMILGCRIREDGSLTPLLKGRVDRALAFRQEQLAATGKDLVFIPSGGRGADERISEAEAMRQYLLSQGIDEAHILPEDQSKNTEENIRFSRRLIKEKDAAVGFSTTNYHVLRAGLMATEQGLKLEGTGAKTKRYFWINAFIREFIGTLYAERKKHLLVFSLIFAAIVCMVGVSYLANNL